MVEIQICSDGNAKNYFYGQCREWKVLRYQESKSNVKAMSRSKASTATRIFFKE